MSSNKTSSNKTIGVIGGLGPEATLDFFQRVLQHTPATQDQDHLHLIINNNPKVPNRNKALSGEGPSAETALVETAQALEHAGADAVVMVCNTAHAYQTAIENTLSIPFISMIDEVVKATLANGASTADTSAASSTVGILAADGCLQAKLYQSAFAKHNVQTLQLSQNKQVEFMQLMYQIKAGQKEQSRQAMQELALHLVDQGAKTIIAGCTEVPLVLKQTDLDVPLIDSTQVLLNAVFQYANIQPRYS